MTALQNCPNCGAPLSPDAPSGLCPRCVMGLGFAAGASLAAPEKAGPDEAGPTIPLAAGDMRPPAAAGDAGRPTGAAARSIGWKGTFTPPSPAELSSHFPQLEVLSLVGQGGMGAVYLARQRGLDRMVALKILPPQAALEPEFAERFHREARALARLNHPHIVTVHDSGRSGDYFYLIMEYIDGVNLRQAMRAGTLTTREALDIVPQICEALQFAHDEGVVHRDIKPENVLLDRKGRVKVADFGLAKLLGADDADFSLTGSHQVMGTPRYMAPEQLEGSRHVDHRADIYSLGVVFYELLTGELPLGRFPPPSRRANLHARIDDIVLRTLEREPQQRYQQASQLKTDVESFGDSDVRGAARASDGSSTPNSSSASSALYGHEYRSPQEMYGWPLLHVAFGMDPKTGQRRRARGIVAVGEEALGVVAIGGIARGGIAIGGVSLGIVAMGGISAGLLAGLGGIATGLYAFGGIVAAMRPLGGIKLGLPLGGGSHLQSFAVAPSLFELLIVGAVIFGIVTAIRAARSGGRSGAGSGSNAAPPPTVPPVVQSPYAVPPAPSRGGGLGWLLALLLIVPCTCGGLGLALTGLFWTKATAIPVHAPMVVMSSSDSQPWNWSTGQPLVGEHLRASLGLVGPQNQIVNSSAHETFTQYLELERAHRRDSTDELGHRVIEIEPLPKIELERLENQFWTTVDATLNPNQSERARALLPMYPRSVRRTDAGRRPPAGHGLLGWGDRGVRIEMWRIGSWFHWTIRTPWKMRIADPNVSNSESSMSATDLPPELRRFWVDEDTPEDTPDPGSATYGRIEFKRPGRMQPPLAPSAPQPPTAPPPPDKAFLPSTIVTKRPTAKVESGQSKGAKSGAQVIVESDD